LLEIRMSNAPTISRQSLLLLLLGADESGATSVGIGGMTRLQKLLFLLWKEAGIEEVDRGFEFKPYKAGPYSRKLYDELELLENLGLIVTLQPPSTPDGIGGRVPVAA
jgi:uncharacterized protein YwgA